MVLSTSEIARRLADDWGLDAATLVPHDGGMNSRTWFVSQDPDRWVAKAVPSDAHARFVSGLAAASHVQAAGIPSGAPVLTQDGQPFVRINGHTLALLTFVNGSGLRGEDPSEQRIIGATLASAHRALIGKSVPQAARFHWIDPEAAYLGVRDWLRPAIREALAAWDRLPPSSLTWGLLHTDPAPEAFLLDAETGVCGLIDWDTGMVGPRMYDLASAVMYVGGTDWDTDLVDAYLEQQVLSRPEVERALDPMLAMRWAVQADYFARRIAKGDLTGIEGTLGNERGLEDARRALAP